MSLKLPRVKLDECLSCPVNVNAFPGKLWKLVNDPNYQSIQWSRCGTTIIVDALLFKDEVLRTGDYSIFKTQNFSSFVRQLNLYGFRKIATTASAKFTEYKTNGKRATYSNPLHCFAHNLFVQHRPDLLSKVKRTSSTSKRRHSFGGQAQSEAANYGQYGGTFRIFGRCGQSGVAPAPSASFVNCGTGAAQKTTIPPTAYNIYPPPSIAGSATQQYFLHNGQSALVPSSSVGYADKNLELDSESESSDADETSSFAALFKKSSAKVLWGQGQKSHLQGDTSSESSPSSQSSSKLSISKAEKQQISDEGTHIASGDFCGRQQKFMVVPQSPKLAVSYRAFPESPSLDSLSNSRIRSPTFWSPVLGSTTHCAMPARLDPEIYGYQQVLDYSSASSQFPYVNVHPSVSYMPYGPTPLALPENMMSMACCSSSPVISTPCPKYTSPKHCNTGNDGKGFQRESFKKVVVKQEVEEAPNSYSALDEDREESSSPRQPHRRFVWNDCDNERESVEMYIKKSEQFHYTTEG